MDSCSYEISKYILKEYLYIYCIYHKDFASKRVIHLMKHGKTKRIRKKNLNRYCSEWKLFVKRRIKK